MVANRVEIFTCIINKNTSLRSVMLRKSLTSLVILKTNKRLRPKRLRISLGLIESLQGTPWNN